LIVASTSAKYTARCKYTSTRSRSLALTSSNHNLLCLFPNDSTMQNHLTLLPKPNQSQFIPDIPAATTGCSVFRNSYANFTVRIYILQILHFNPFHSKRFTHQQELLSFPNPPCTHYVNHSITHHTLIFICSQQSNFNWNEISSARKNLFFIISNPNLLDSIQPFYITLF